MLEKGRPNPAQPESFMVHTARLTIPGKDGSEPTVYEVTNGEKQVRLFWSTNNYLVDDPKNHEARLEKNFVETDPNITIEISPGHTRQAPKLDADGTIVTSRAVSARATAGHPTVLVLARSPILEYIP